MAEASLSCYTRRDQGEVVLAFEGALDVLTAPRAMRVLQEFVEQYGPDVVLDTARLDFIDSKGVGALISGAKATRSVGGKVYLLNPATPVQKILEMCGLRSMFPPHTERPRPVKVTEVVTPAAPVKTARGEGTRIRPAKQAA